MKASELHDLLVTNLVKTQGGTRRRWRMAIGSIRLKDATTHPHCNWSVEPSGAEPDIAAIERLLDDVRQAHPLVTAG